MNRSRHLLVSTPVVLRRGFRMETPLEPVPLGKRLPKKHNSRPYGVGTHFIHSEIGYRGVVLYPWEAVVTSDSSESSPKNYYQCLVDNRDAEMLPMELETLRVPEERQSKKEVKPIRFKNWDLVSHNEILHYQPVADTNTPIFQHHLLHHFLEEKIVKAKKGKRNKTIRGTPTLSFWKRKFSSKSLKLYETSKALEEDVVLKIYHVPYYLYTKKDSEVIAHLARFHSDSLRSQFEVIERVTLVEDSEGLVEETSQPMSIQLGGNFNHIYQHSRHIEVPRNSKYVTFVYSVRVSDSDTIQELTLPRCNLNSVYKR